MEEQERGHEVGDGHGSAVQAKAVSLQVEVNVKVKAHDDVITMTA